MKRCFAVLGVVLFLASISGVANAIQNTGNWNLLSSRDLGSWEEHYYGGGPGQPGNVINAWSWAGRWDLANTLVTAELVGSGSGYDVYSTEYDGGNMWLTGAPSFWGDEINVTVQATNTSTNYYNGNLDFDIVIFGSDGGYDYLVEASFTGVLGNNYTSLSDRHWGQEFDVLNLTITETAPVPEPGTMLLFGTGLLGLAGIRRRKKK